jgi:uncharacterized membrane protein HdeD (DUF308 family)
MKKNFSIFLYGIIPVLVGFFLQFSENSSLVGIKIFLGVSLIVGSIFAIVSAITRRKDQVQLAYHEMHAFAMLVYSITLFIFCDSMEKLIACTTFLFIFYFFSEIIFCFWIYNLEQKVMNKIVAIRLLLGLFVGIGTIVAMNYTEYTMQIFGLLFILVGLNIVLYVPVMKGKESVLTFKYELK